MKDSIQYVLKTQWSERSLVIHILGSKQKNGKAIKQNPLKSCGFSEKEDKQMTGQLEIYCMLYWFCGKKKINRGQKCTKWKT